MHETAPINTKSHNHTHTDRINMVEEKYEEAENKLPWYQRHSRMNHLMSWHKGSNSIADLNWQISLWLLYNTKVNSHTMKRGSSLTCRDPTTLGIIIIRLRHEEKAAQHTHIMLIMFTSLAHPILDRVGLKIGAPSKYQKCLKRLWHTYPTDFILKDILIFSLFFLGKGVFLSPVQSFLSQAQAMGQRGWIARS